MQCKYRYLSRTLAVAVCFSATLVDRHAAAETVSWEAAVAKVEASVKEYRDYARQAGGKEYNAGIGLLLLDYHRHRCAILGRMLDRTEAVRELEELVYPPLNAESDPWDLFAFSYSLENWAQAAREALQQEEYQRINIWNLDCAGEMGIPASLSMDSPKPNAEFEYRDGKLLVYGDIEPGFYGRFLRALGEHPDVKEVWLASRGGSVHDAILVGREIRERGLSTQIHGNCHSECPLMFFGGATRQLWRAPHRLGFNQISGPDGQPVAMDDSVYALVLSYLKEMGIGAEEVIGWMRSAPPSEIYEPEPAQFCDPEVATFMQGVWCGE